MADEIVLTHPFLRPGKAPLGPEERRRQALSRTTSTVLMVALHLVFFIFFVFVVHPYDMRTRPIIETILSLPLAALVTAPQTAAGWNGPYLQKNTALIDPWGQAYLWRIPGQHGEADG